MVGIDSDKKVKKDKGVNRPYNTAADRKFVLECIKYVDEVVVFDSKSDLEKNIESYAPDIMVIGSDWKGKKVIGQQYCTELRFFDRIKGYSTTKVLENRK